MRPTLSLCLRASAAGEGLRRSSARTYSMCRQYFRSFIFPNSISNPSIVCPLPPNLLREITLEQSNSPSWRIFSSFEPCVARIRRLERLSIRKLLSFGCRQADAQSVKVEVAAGPARLRSRLVAKMPLFVAPRVIFQGCWLLNSMGNTHCYSSCMHRAHRTFFLSAIHRFWL